MTRKAEKYFFQGGSAGALLQCGDSVASQEAASVNYGHAIREKLHFGESVRGEEQGSLAMAKDFRFQEAAKLRGGDGVEAARGLVEKQDTGLVKKCASQAEALDRAGGKRAHLAVERFAELKLLGELQDSLGRGGTRKQIQLAEEEQILARRKPRIEAVVRARVIAQAAADVARVLDGVVAGDSRVAACGDKKRGDNSEKRGFTRSVGAEKSKGLSFTNLERHPCQRNGRGLFEWLEKSAPTAARGRERLRKRFDADRGFGHQGLYSLSSVWKQSGPVSPAQRREAASPIVRYVANLSKPR